MKILIQPQAVSWKERMVKVCGQWARIGPRINLKQIRIGQDHWAEVVTNLDGKKVVEKIYQ